ncbi:MAG: hypothetical protein CMN01_04340, partial [Rickettsiales bacterium]|nr:hypothetical protein [Rickettsiales bacterium]
MKKNKLLLNLITFSLLFFLIDSSHSQESEIKKIIIDNNSDRNRLLSPPTDGPSKRIKLIPPKNIQEEERLRAEQQKQEEERIKAEKRKLEKERLRAEQQKQEEERIKAEKRKL